MLANLGRVLNAISFPPLLHSLLDRSQAKAVNNSCSCCCLSFFLLLQLQPTYFTMAHNFAPISYVSSQEMTSALAQAKQFAYFTHVFFFSLPLNFFFTKLFKQKMCVIQVQSLKQQ